jgi:hypothetical protein
MKKAIFFLFTLFAIFQFASAQKEGMAAINKNDIKAYMTFLASDQLEGRETGTPANDISALFIKENLMRLGVKPASSLNDYFQKIPLYSTRIRRDDSFLRIYGKQGETLYSTDSVVVLSRPSKTVEASGNVVFAGYGYQDAATGYDDFSGISLKDKIVIIMTRNPSAVSSKDKGKVFDQQLEGPKFRTIFTGGPKAVLFVYDPENDFPDAYASGLASLIPASTVSMSEQQASNDPFQFMFITRHTADMMLKATGYNLKLMQDKISKTGSPVSVEISEITASVRTSIETSKVSGSNVIGIIEGSDPVLKNECIIYTAHFDHVGKNQKGEIMNGADDNASGSIGLLEVADAFMKLKHKPLRSIVFAWVNGEEKGLLGSQFYVRNPVFPLENTLVDINLDMIGRSKLPSDTGKFAGFDLNVTQPNEIQVYTAHESSEIINMMNSAALETGISITDKGKDMEFGGSDHQSFMARGIPALFFNSGIHRDLHSAGDDVEKIDFDKMEKVSKMVFLLGYKAANQKKRIEVDNPLKP